MNKKQIAAIVVIFTLICVVMVYVNIPTTTDYIEFTLDNTTTVTDRIQEADTDIINNTTFVVATSDSLSKGGADFVCDGNDDQVEIQAAIDALPIIGGTIICMDGNYEKGDITGISIPSNVKIELLSGATIRLKDDIGDDAVIFTNSDTINGNTNICICGGIIDGNAKNQTTGLQYGVKVNNTNDSEINCSFKGFTGKNVRIVDSNARATQQQWSTTSCPEFASNIDQSSRKKIVERVNQVISECDNLNTWTIDSGSVSVDISNYRTGAGSLKLTTPDTAYRYASLSKDVSLNMTNKFIKIWIYIDPIAPIDEIALYLYSHATQCARTRIDISGATQKGGWIPITFAKTPAVYLNGFVDASYSNITKTTIAARTHRDMACIVYIDRIEVIDVLPNNGIVIFRFDDGMQTDYTVAKKYMDVYGFKGNTFIITDVIGTSYGGERLTLDQLHELNDGGWEIGSHTLSHPHLNTLPINQSVSEIEDSQRWLLDNGFIPKFFAPPYHELASDTGAKAEEYYLMDHWGIPSWSPDNTFGVSGGSRALTVPPADFNPYHSCISWKTNISAIECCLQSITDNQEILVIITHETTNETAFQNVVNAVYASGASVYTYSELYDLITTECDDI